MITCFVIDDEKPAIKVLTNLIGLVPELELIGTAFNPIEGLHKIEQQKPDLLFLDIEMAMMDGIELARMLDKKTKVIFCTAFTDYAVQSYEVSAVDYLLKPIEFPRFKIAVQKVIDIHLGKVTPVDEISDDYILVKQGEKGKLHKIDIDDVVAIKGCKNYVQFYCRQSRLMVYVSMKELENRLPFNAFFRVHKSYIIAIKHIASVEGNEITMIRNDVKVLIGSSYKAAFLERVKGNMI